MKWKLVYSLVESKTGFLIYQSHISNISTYEYLVTQLCMQSVHSRDTNPMVTKKTKKHDEMNLSHEIQTRLHK